MYTSCFSGNLGSDVDFAYSKTGEPYAKMNVAVYQGKDKEPLWVRVVLFGKPAEILAAQSPKKGEKVIVQCTVPPVVSMYEKLSGATAISFDQKAVWVEACSRRDG
jgi:hypothetical protein